MKKQVDGRRYMVEFTVGGTYTIDGKEQMTESDFLAWGKTLNDNDHLIMVNTNGEQKND